jgi:virulence factor Mce-like protein
VVSYNGVPFRPYEYIYASAPQMGNLLQHDPVRIGGVRVGQVASISLDSEDRPVARLQIEPGTHLTSDTRMLIRANGLLGARYVELIPGTSRQTMPAGTTIYGGPDSITFGLPDVLNTFDQRTRTGLGQMVGGLGQGFFGQGEALGQALSLAPAGVWNDEQLIGALYSRTGAVQRLIPSLDSAAAPLAANSSQLAALPNAAAAAVQPFVDEQAALRSTLDQAPGALSTAQAGLGSGDQLLVSVTGLATQLSRTLPYAPAGLRGASALLRSSHTPLARAQTLLAAVHPAVPAALKITGSVPPLLGPLDQLVSNLTPMLLEISRYGCNVTNWGAAMRSMDEAAGIGQGPLGWVGEFRAAATVLSPTATFGYGGPSQLLPRDGYSPPCKYLASNSYPSLIDGH